MANPDGVKEDRYEQLFISTHNLDFLKYLKKLTKPKEGGKEQFMVSRTTSGSKVELMPTYLKNYITEFHYLFDQIYLCTKPENIASNHNCFFGFGNNLRKFMEIYLFFKYPFCDNADRDYNTRITRFFNDDPATEPMVQRVTNELSHGGEIFDRSVRPVEPSEITKMAKYVLQKIKDVDLTQYGDLVQAVEQEPNIQ